MKVTPYAWKEMTTVEDWMKLNHSMKCRQKCGNCSKTWKAASSKFINYLYSPPDPKPLYICDHCLENMADSITIKK